jgi:hypothetical protein
VPLTRQQAAAAAERAGRGWWCACCEGIDNTKSWFVASSKTHVEEVEHELYAGMELWQVLAQTLACKGAGHLRGHCVPSWQSTHGRGG